MILKFSKKIRKLLVTKKVFVIFFFQIFGAIYYTSRIFLGVAASPHQLPLLKTEKVRSAAMEWLFHKPLTFIVLEFCAKWTDHPNHNQPERLN
jgi:hypothetical protein